MQLRKRIAVSLALVIGAASVLSGCSGSSSSTSVSSGSAASSAASSETSSTASASGKKIYYTTSSQAAANINPHGATSSFDSDIIQFVTSALYRYVPTEDRQSCVLAPDLAADVPEQVDDYTWHIKIDERACWQDGTPITADTFIQSWKWGLDPKMLWETGTNLASSPNLIVKNAMAYYTQGDSNSVAWEDVGFKKVDDLTIEVVTEQRFTQQDVMRFFAANVSAPVNTEMYESLMDAEGLTTQYGTEADKFIACGPFKLTTWVKGSERVYEKNENYLHADEIKLDGINSKIINDTGTQLQMFESGQIDYLPALSADGYAKYEEDPRTVVYGSRVVRQIEINRSNTEKPILGSKKFRQALYYALDRETLAALGKHTAAPYYCSSTLVAYADGTKFRDLPESQSYVPENGGYDPEKAKELFDEACAEVGQTEKLVLTMNYYDSREDVKMMAEYIQKAWPEVFGTDKIEIKLQALPSASLFDTMKACQTDPNSYELSWGSWSWSSADFCPVRDFEPFQSTYSRRNSNYNNAEVDALYAESMTEEVRLDEKRLVEIAQEIEQIYIDDVLALPVFEVVNKCMFSERVITPVESYVSGLGWGEKYFDLAE